ncbi:MAG: paraquat-inducible protein A [Candidatus Deferrimicrobium sp.]|nr:paraquat-inducible protein A [Candidatus Deferrimicrobium sp.]
MTRVSLTGAKAGVVLCDACGLLSRPAGPSVPGNCPRCGEAMAFRRRNPIQRTWALIIAAAICYLPANFLPVMTTTTLKSVRPDTIIGGVVRLYESGSWVLALIVLVASVMIPLVKLTALAYLLITVQLRSNRRRRERVRLYRMLKAIGRWSMLDVFVATVVVALVQLRPFMSVVPKSGVMFFTAVVILTIFAANTFDPRLIWDSGGETRGEDD